MTEHDQPQPPIEAMQPTAQAGIEYEAFHFDNGEYRVFIPTLIDTSGRKTHLINRSNYRAAHSLSVLAENGISAHEMNQDGTLSSLAGAEDESAVAIAFTPSAAAHVALMERAGHQDSRLMALKRHISVGHQTEDTKAMAVLTDLTQLSEALNSEVVPEGTELLHTLLKYKFSQHYTSEYDVLDNLVKNGLEDPQFSRIVDRINDGMQPELLTLSVEAPTELDELTSAAWTEVVAVAKQYNKDQHNKGIYTEIHRVGNAMVPLSAIASTQWNSHDSQLGFVEEGSGHTLAMMYDIIGNVSQPDYLDRLAANLKATQLVRALGLQHGSTATQVERCRMQFNDQGEAVIVLQPIEQLQKQGYKVNRQQTLKNMQRLGIKVAVGEIDKVHEAQSDAGLSVKNTFIEAPLLPEQQIAGNEYQMIVTDIQQDDQGTEVQWAGGNSKRHAELLKSLGLPENTAPSVTIGDKTYTMTGRYQASDLSKVGINEVQESLLWILEGNEGQQINMEALSALVQASDEVIMAHVDERMPMRSGALKSRVLVNGDVIVIASKSSGK